MYVLALLVALAAFFQQGTPPPEQQAKMRQEAEVAAKKYRDEAVHLNDAAGHIRSEAEARALVDAVAEMFSNELPPSWATDGVRARVAHAEFEAASSAALIPEQRVANVWNAYVREIGAPSETAVTPAEVHHLRDMYYSTSVRMWERGWNQSIWTMPSIYALGADGRVASGCRALELLRVLHDLDSNFENLRTARLQMQQGIVVSDLLKKHEEAEKNALDKSPKTRVSARLETRVVDNPVWTAERRYIDDHGQLAFSALLLKLFDQLFPE